MKQKHAFVHSNSNSTNLSASVKLPNRPMHTRVRFAPPGSV